MKKLVYYLIIFLFIFLPVNVFARSDSIKVTFDSCVDGDTAKFNYNDEVIKVRFLAIDTPETKHPKKGVENYGKEASNFTCNEITNATNIVLEFDEESDEKDKYDRYLAWVFIDEELLQTKLVENGYAKVAYLYGDYKYTSVLQEKENIAKERKLGLWSDNDTSIETADTEDNLDIYDYIYLVILIICFVIALFKYIKKIKRKFHL